MPARSKSYPLVTPAGGASVRPVPNNPKRISLVIQNTGANPGQVRFGDPNQGPGIDFTWTAGFIYKWDQADTCPIESVNLSSVLGTSWMVLEGIPLKTGELGNG